MPHTSSTPVIEVMDLHKSYGGRNVVDGVSFTVEEGEIFGILGPNGAGKTTTVECVEGLRVPDTGRVRVAGLDPVAEHEATRRVLGAQLQESELQPFGYAVALVLAVLVALALGAVISAVSRTTKISAAIGSAVFFPAMFCAGVWMPVQTMPDVLARSVGYTPFGAAAQALNEAAAGDWPGWDHLGVLAAWTVLLTFAASRWFRWE
ncbi:ATP-binding cassette domain-containing protein [Streptomyces phaeolivaceus]|uniref:ATP-binding cassette domain-containing protein n=2 Tax=Streptomyces phaeolivaceus TaxID=2653200 RepID=A0A5P8KBN2_9ACTN|nr:ATP-binding cassette domain-containing protein [Streptomyces phaeolivaceus]QFR00407.1 ATP-binding cassette domain-containing protein [Streptomyces phaeolivaceus]